VFPPEATALRISPSFRKILIEVVSSIILSLIVIISSVTVSTVFNPLFPGLTASKI